MTRREFTSEYKTRIVLEVLEGEKLAVEIACREGINPRLLSLWKQEFLKNAHRAFTISREENAVKKELNALEELNKELTSKVGVLTMENDWLKKKSKEACGYEVAAGSRYRR